MIYPHEELPLVLSVYMPDQGWGVLAMVPSTSEGVSLSRGGGVVVWRVLGNTVPEEAELGEIFVADVMIGSVPRALTRAS